MPSLSQSESPRAWIDDPRVPHGVEPEGGAADAEFAAGRDLAALLARLVIDGHRQSVLEFGAGSSSRVFAQSLASTGGGRLTSVEASPQWCGSAWEHVERCEAVDAQLVQAPVTSRFTPQGYLHGYWSAAATIAERGPFDLVFIDGPQGCFGRDASLWLAVESLADDAVIVLDDAARWKERATVRRWLRTLGGLELLVHDTTFNRGKGVAVLGRGAAVRPRFSSRAFVSANCIAAVNWWSRLQDPSAKAA